MLKRAALRYKAIFGKVPVKAKKLVSVIGGRLVNLHSCVNICRITIVKSSYEKYYQGGLVHSAYSLKIYFHKVKKIIQKLYKHDCLEVAQLTKSSVGERMKHT